MKLLFLHGSPATGKLTVANALLGTVPGRLFDNHAAIDLARTMFEFGAPGFWELVHGVRCSAIEAAATHGVPLVVMTFCYVEPDDRTQLENFEEIVRRHGGDFHAAFLRCSREEAMRRVGNPDRVERRKIATEGGLERYLARHTFSPVARPGCLTIDTDRTTAVEAAEQLARHFALNAAPGPRTA